MEEPHLSQPWMGFLTTQLRKKQNTHDTQQELALLRFFKSQLQGTGAEAEPLPPKLQELVDGVSFESKVLDEEALPEFVFYIFERRFGWSERGPSIQESDEYVQYNFNQLNAQKTELNRALDFFLEHYRMLSVDHCLELACGLRDVTKRTEKPVVRQQAFRYFFDWTKLRLHPHLATLSPNTFEVLRDLVISGLTDVWSAIRKTSSRKLYSMLHGCSLAQVEDLFTCFMDICQRPSTGDNAPSWQQQEGALLGITVIIKRFNLVRRGSTDNGRDSEVAEDPSRRRVVPGVYVLKFGSETLTALPSFITKNLRPTLSIMLAHEQLTVRDYAMKAFTAYLSRSRFTQIEITFFEIVHKLKTPSADGPGSPSRTHVSPPLHTRNVSGMLRSRSDVNLTSRSPSSNNSYDFVSAYEADGLLSVCEILVNLLPCSFLLNQWRAYYSILERYLAHPASTVRQKTSAIFLRLASRSSLAIHEADQLVVRLCLQNLAADWPSPLASTSPQYLLSSGNRPSIEENDRKQVYTEAPVHSSLPPQLPCLCHRAVQASSVCPIQSHQKGTDDPALSSVTETKTWEWKEGRLLAYELILERISAEHVFTTYASGNSVSQLASTPVVARHQSHSTPRADVVESTPSPLQGFEEGLSPTKVPRNRFTFTPSPHRSRPCRRHASGGAQPAADYITDVMELSKTGASFFPKRPPVSSSKSVRNMIRRRRRMSVWGMYGLSKNSKLEIIRDEDLESGERDLSLLRRLNLLDSLDLFADPEQNGPGFSSTPTSASPAHANRAVPDSQELTLLDRGLVPLPRPHDPNPRLFHECTPAAGLSSLLRVPTVPSTPLSNDTQLIGRVPSPSRPVKRHQCADCLLEQRVESMAFVSFPMLLRSILLQTVSCSFSPRWELRRMADQVFPHLIKVICHYDASLVVQMWEPYLMHDSLFMNCVACLSLKYTLKHVQEQFELHNIDLSEVHNAADSNSSVLLLSDTVRSYAQKHPELPKQVLDLCELLALVCHELPRVLHLTHFLSQHCVSDKVVTLCHETLIMAYSCFTKPVLLHNTGDQYLKLVFKRMWAIRTIIVGKVELILPAQQSQVAQECRRVERWILQSTHHLLPALMANNPLSDILSATPVMLDLLVRAERSDADVQTSLLTSISTLLTRVQACLSSAPSEQGVSLPSDVPMMSMLERYTEQAAGVLCSIMLRPGLEAGFMRSILGVMQLCCSLFASPTVFATVMKCFHRKLLQENNGENFLNSSQQPGSPLTAPSLSMPCPTIPASPSLESLSSVDSDELSMARDSRGTKPGKLSPESPTRTIAPSFSAPERKGLVRPKVKTGLQPRDYLTKKIKRSMSSKKMKKSVSKGESLSLERGYQRHSQYEKQKALYESSFLTMRSNDICPSPRAMSEANSYHSFFDAASVPHSKSKLSVNIPGSISNEWSEAEAPLSPFVPEPPGFNFKAARQKSLLRQLLRSSTTPNQLHAPDGKSDSKTASSSTLRHAHTALQYDQSQKQEMFAMRTKLFERPSNITRSRSQSDSNINYFSSGHEYLPPHPLEQQPVSAVPRPAALEVEPFTKPIKAQLQVSLPQPPTVVEAETKAGDASDDWDDWDEEESDGGGLDGPVKLAPDFQAMLDRLSASLPSVVTRVDCGRLQVSHDDTFPEVIYQRPFQHLIQDADLPTQMTSMLEWIQKNAKANLM